MILKKIEYYENKGKPNHWEIEDVEFVQLNIVVGLNATGKTLLITLISTLAQMISKNRNRIDEEHCCWSAKFLDKFNNDVYVYNLELINRIIVSEILTYNGKEVLKRSLGQGQIFSCIKNEMLNISPPSKELTLHVRRDMEEFPFLEKLYNWATSFYTFDFTDKSISFLYDKKMITDFTSALGLPSYLLHLLLKDEKNRNIIIEDFTSVGYPIDDLKNEKMETPGIPKSIFIPTVKEKDLACFTGYYEMSRGMSRVFSLIVIIEYLLSLKQECTIAIDDIGEGLDFDRSTKITRLIFDKLKDSNIQLIASSNDRFLINAVDRTTLNILEREGHVVKSYNYSNSKEIFDDYEITGLTNFDFFSGQMYK
ncbi:MAG: ATP-binding protein [Nitrospirae bacterium]|nr:ATP-binding protein [Nitrospirota bacterium]